MQKSKVLGAVRDQVVQQQQQQHTSLGDNWMPDKLLRILWAVWLNASG